MDVGLAYLLAWCNPTREPDCKLVAMAAAVCAGHVSGVGVRQCDVYDCQPLLHGQRYLSIYRTVSIVGVFTYAFHV